MRVCNWKEVNVMKKSLLFYSLSGLMALAGLTGCEEKLELPANPAKAGDEINFGVASNESAITRTIYDDEPTTDEAGNTYYRVTWEPYGSDQIAIYCPQAEGKTLCKYSVTPDADDPTKSDAVTKVNANESGLLWGNTNEHHFFGFYPASAVTGTEDGMIRGTIPVEQRPTGWKEVTNEKGGKTIYGKANTDYAFMWAYGKFNRIENPEDYNIPLTFHPWVTILEIKIPGPAANTGNVSISNVNIRATGGNQKILTGDFTCDMNAVEDAVDAGSALGNIRPTYEAVGDLGAVRNTISIPCYRDGEGDEQGDFVTLTGPNDTLVVHAYLLPYSREEGENRQLQVRVSPVSRPVLTLSLNTENGTDRVEPYKVNTVILPPVENREGNNYWLSSLDENIYLSELSIPGSWNSMDSGEGNSNYQNGTVTEQFNAGARAFMVSTGSRYTREPSKILGSGGGEYKDGDLYVAVNGTRQNTKFTEIIDQLHTALVESQNTNHTNEFVFVQLTYETANDYYFDYGTIGWNEQNPGAYSNPHEAWIRTVQNDLNELKNLDYIYTDEITNNTTIDMVKGKIILKVNTNSEFMDNIIAADATLPALFSRWDGGYKEDGIPLRWGSPNLNNSYGLTWFYQEVGNIEKNGEDHEPTEATASLSQKKTWISNVFTKSVDLYNTGSDHSTWFFNCLGGNFSDDSYNAKAFTAEISPWATEQLQMRTDNASLGIVVMNHVNGDDSKNILQTVIDNNFKFQLRKAGN